MSPQGEPPIEVSKSDVAGELNIDDKKGGYYLRWSRIYKSVEIKNEAAGGLMGASSISASFKAPETSGKKGVKKVILNDVSGFARPGEVLAIMGPSGSGKTSIMNALSGRSKFESGVISINGEAASSQILKRLMAKIAYVKQADVFFDHLSVRDQLTYTALLRMPANLPASEKHEEVERVLRMLRLSKVADSAIFLISGGEKKRVNIGTELLTDPEVLLLDEPTSGLDSTSAVSLLKLLQNLAVEDGKTVITSIHQPQSSVFRSFDRLMMMSDGHVVYFGSPVDSLQYLREQQLPCPDGYNAADHWMDLLVTDSAVEEEREENFQDDANDDAQEDADQPPKGELRRRRGEQGRKMASPRYLLQRAWDSEAMAEQIDAEVVQGTKDDHDGNIDLATTSKYNTSWATQYFVLIHRALKNSRSAIFTPLNLIKSLALGLVSGMLWFQMSYTEADVNDIRSYYFFTMTFWPFDAMFNALTAFPAERNVILRERASASYRLSAYFLAKTTSDVPVRIMLPFLYMTVSFWMAGFEDRFSVFIGTIGCTLLSVVAGEALGLFVGAAIMDLQQAMAVMTVGTLMLMLVGGFFVESVPGFVSWTKYLSPFKYAFDSSLQVIFDRDIPCDGSGQLGDLCAQSLTGFAEIEDVRDFFKIQGSIGFNVGMLLVIGFLPRYFAYVALRRTKDGERS